MANELKIPEVGESITEVQISEWLKSEGDELKADESVAVIDSEKTTFDLPSPKAGKLTKILRKAGETVKIGEAIAEIEPSGTGGEGKSTGAKSERKSKIEFEAGTKSETPPAGKAATERKREETESKDGKPSAPTEEKPAAMETEATAKTPAAGEEEVVPLTMLRRTAARRLVEAQQTMAMLTTFNEVDMSTVQTLRREQAEAFEKRYQVRLGLMSFFVKAAIDALKQYPKLNAEIRDDDVVYRNYFDIGVAIASERGLVVPVLRHAERLSFAELEQAIGKFAQRAREAKLKPDDLEGGTFTITNGGVFGSLLSTPIINPPQTGILGMHTIQDRPVAIDGHVVIRPMMYLALTYDHRLVDGQEAVLFLRRIKETIEAPARMLMEI